MLGKHRDLNLDKIVEKQGKFKIIFNVGEKIPAQHVYEFVEGVGIAIRTCAELAGATKWKEVSQSNKDLCRKRLLHWFEIEGWNTERVQKLVNQALQKSYRTWRNVLHVKYQNILKNKGDPKDECPRPEVAMDQWIAFVNHVQSTTFKTRSVTNSENRKKKRYNHTSGKIRMLSRYRRMAIPRKIENWKNNHLTKSGTFVNEEAANTYNEMKRRETEALEEAAEPISEDSIFAATLGERPVTRKVWEMQ